MGSQGCWVPCHVGSQGCWVPCRCVVMWGHRAAGSRVDVLCVLSPHHPHPPPSLLHLRVFLWPFVWACFFRFTVPMFLCASLCMCCVVYT